MIKLSQRSNTNHIKNNGHFQYNLQTFSAFCFEMSELFHTFAYKSEFIKKARPYSKQMRTR